MCGSSPALQFGDDATQEISKYFKEGHFPAAALSRTELFKEEVWAPLLRTDEGDPSVATFLPRDEFKVWVPGHTEHVEVSDPGGARRSLTLHCGCVICPVGCVHS